MARSVSQAIITRMLNSSIKPLLPAPQPHRLVNSRARSYIPNKSQKGTQFELEDVTEAERITIKKVEDAIHSIVAKRVQPLWLPLLPGGSFWVPPAIKEKGFVGVIENLERGSSSSVSSKVGEAPLGSRRSCWPSHEYFFKGE